MSQESEIRGKEATSASEGEKEYGNGKEGDVANDLGNREKDDRKRKGVKTWTDREYSGVMEGREKS